MTFKIQFVDYSNNQHIRLNKLTYHPDVLQFCIHTNIILMKTKTLYFYKIFPFTYLRRQFQKKLMSPRMSIHWVFSRSKETCHKCWQLFITCQWHAYKPEFRVSSYLKCLLRPTHWHIWFYFKWYLLLYVSFFFKLIGFQNNWGHAEI